MTAASDANRRIYFSAENGTTTVQTTDRLVRDTNLLLTRAGLRVGPSKVSRLVRAWRGALTVDGAEFIAYLAAKLGLTERQRATLADQYRRVISYADPTGEEAVRNVMAAR